MCITFQFFEYFSEIAWLKAGVENIPRSHCSSRSSRSPYTISLQSCTTVFCRIIGVCVMIAYLPDLIRRKTITDEAK